MTVEYSVDDPGAGDLSGLMAMATSLRQRSEHLQDAAGRIAAANDQVDARTWQGLSAAAWRTVGPVVVVACQNTAQVLHEGAAAITQYVMLVETIQANQRVPVEQMAEADTTMHLCATTDWFTGNRFVSDPSLIPQVQSLVHQEAWESRRQARAQLVQMHRDRQDAEERLIAVLTSAQFVDQVRSSHRVLSANGSVAPGALDAAAVAELTRLTSTVDAGGGQVTRDQEQLRSLLDLYGRDHGVMDTVIIGVGAAGVLTAIRGLSADTATTGGRELRSNLGAAAVLRESFARCSRGLDPVRDRHLIDRWADQIVAGELGRDPSGWASAVGYLFEGPDSALMGEHLTVAVADRIDAHERQTGEPWVDAAVPSGTRQLVTEVHDEAAGLRVGDPGARVRQMLAAHPDAALP